MKTMVRLSPQSVCGLSRLGRFPESSHPQIWSLADSSKRAFRRVVLETVDGDHVVPMPDLICSTRTKESVD